MSANWYTKYVERETLFTIADYIKVPEPKKGRFDFEFQQLGVELEPIYGKGVWTLPYKPNFTEYKIREAHRICQQRGITTLGYLIGVVNKLV